MSKNKNFQHDAKYGCKVVAIQLGFQQIINGF